MSIKDENIIPVFFISVVVVGSLSLAIVKSQGNPEECTPRTVAPVEGIDAGRRQVDTAVPCASPSSPVESLDSTTLKAYMVESVK